MEIHLQKEKQGSFLFLAVSSSYIVRQEIKRFRIRQRYADVIVTGSKTVGFLAIVSMQYIWPLGLLVYILYMYLYICSLLRHEATK